MLPDLPKLKTIISKSYVNVRLACRLCSFVSLNLFFPRHIISVDSSYVSFSEPF